MVRDLILAVAGCAAFVVVAPPANAVEPLMVAGSAPAAAHGPGTVRFTYALKVPNDLDSVTVTTVQDSRLPADAASVKVDGTVLAGSAITSSGGDLTLTLGPVSAGAHTVSFDALVQATPSVRTSSSADVSYMAAGVQPATAHSAPVTVDINEPDITLDPGFGDAPIPEFPVGTDTAIGLFLDVSNTGYGAPPTTLRIEMPTGLQIWADEPPSAGGRPLACTPTAPGITECALGQLKHGQHLSVDLSFEASPTAVPGTRATLKIAAIPEQGVDQNPTDNDAIVPIHFTGLAHLTSRLSPRVVKIKVGQSAVVAVTVHNAGPQPADFAEAFLNLEDDAHFAIAAFDGEAADSPAPDNVQWLIGTLDPGQTATAHVTVRAMSAGTTQMSVDPQSRNASNPSCDQKQCLPETTLTAVNATTVVATPTPSPTTAPSRPGSNLADTGAMSWPLAGLGVCMLLLGAALIGAARLARAERRANTPRHQCPRL